jgi:Asp-tRNA(Asn)/Glu-tRNA(Gln) amidotransferase A subunit family amidase
VVVVAAAMTACGNQNGSQRASQSEPAKPFHLLEATIDDIHNAYKSGQLTSRQLTQLYLNRIEAYDKQGPHINAIINLNPNALADADKLDAQFKASGFVGPLHGIPVVVKDQADAAGMPMTLGSVMLKDYVPDKDAFAVEKVRRAGAIILGKTTLGEFGGGDTYGSLFGISRNPYAPDRTVGGSSGGTGASLSANLTAVGIGEEGFASIRRPSTWNSVVGMRPTGGLISRTGMFAGWPSINGSLGPMARTVKDLATVLDAMAGYDSEDPLTALSVGHVPDTYTRFLDKNGLKGARIGVIRDLLGGGADPNAEDFKRVTEVFDKAIGEMKAAGAEIVDPLVVPNLRALLAKRMRDPVENESFQVFFGRNSRAPYKTREEIVKSPDFAKMFPATKDRIRDNFSTTRDQHYDSLVARDTLLINVLKAMADNKLDAIVHKSMESLPPRIIEKPYPTSAAAAGPPTMNTFLVYVPVLAMPAGFTSDDLPVGVTFQGRPFDEGTLIKLAYSFEQATHHRKPPKTTPPLDGEP